MTARRLGKLDQMRVLATDDDRAVLAHQTHKLGEGGLDLLDTRVMIEMVGLDVGHDDHIGVKEQEGAVGLIRLGDKIVARAVLAVGIVALNNATDQEAGVQTHAVEHGGTHRRGRGLAVSTGDGDGGVAVAQSREHLARGHTGIPSSRARRARGWTRGIAVETTTTSGLTSSMVAASWPHAPSRRRG